VYHGGGGFIHSEVYNMPIWLRTFHVKKINEFHKEENEKISKAQKGQSTTNKPVQGPNINPSSVYNFKK
jgi:hypothetical protein